MRDAKFRASSWMAALLPWAMLVGFGGAIGLGWLTVPARQPVSGLAQGIAALHANDYKAARQVFETLAEKNDQAGEIWLAHIYRQGLGVPTDAQKAVTLLTKAADAGSAEAAARLGKIYLDGDGVLQDVGQAQSWLSRAAHEGNAAAQRDLGLLYERGLGVQKEPTKAYVWLAIAARNGDAQALDARDRVLASLSQADATRATAEAAQTLKVLAADEKPAAAPAPAAKDAAPSTAQGAAPVEES
ncbi:MAG: sel1 repeat family protein [Alphaproteobacteria bacterium]|nr:sel1 repeat family protein [Alphaproteobacteria bacterium]